MVTDLSNAVDVSRKKKMMWIISMFSGANNYPISIAEMISHLQRRGNQMTVVGFKPKNRLNLEKTGARFLQIPIFYVPIISPLLFSIIVAILLPFLLLYYKSEIVLFMPDLSLVGAVPTVSAFRIGQRKFVLDVRSTPVETHGFRGFLQRLSFSLSVNVSKKVLNGLTTITELMKQELSSSYGIAPEKVGVWTSGVNLEHFDPEFYVKEAGNIRKQLGLEGKFVVFYHGALSENRGIFETARSMKYVVNRFPEIVFFILGGGSIKKQLEEYILKERLTKNILLHQRVPYSQVPSYIAMSDVCIIPLPRHPFWMNQSPLKLLEYLAMQKTVILSDLPAHKSAVGKSRGAIFLKSIEPREIAERILYAYENWEKLDDWGKGGKEIVAGRFSWDRISLNLEKYLTML